MTTRSIIGWTAMATLCELKFAVIRLLRLLRTC